MPRISSDQGVLRIARFLKQSREAAHLSREQVARMVGAKYETIRQYEEGQSVMKIDRLVELLEAVGISVDDCFPLQEADRGAVTPEARKMAERLCSLDRPSYLKLMRQITALIELESGAKR